MSVQELEKEQEPKQGSFGLVAWLRWVWRTLTSMKTALILLFLLALGSVPGSLVPQRSVEPDKVAQLYEQSPALAEWYDRLQLFEVFSSTWFAAVYLLLFTSLIGCIIPRTATYLRELRRKPPAAPKNLSRLPHADSFDSALEVDEAARRLRKLRFRVVTGDGWVSAEKGYLRETGNLFFHVALLGILLAIGAGSLYGYRGNVLVVEGDGFANTVAAYDRFMPGNQVSAESLQPFSFTLSDFKVAYQVAGDKRGQALDYSAHLKVSDTPAAPARDYELKVNEPLEVDGTQMYLIGNGYAPVFKVTDGKGQVAFEGPVPCLIEQKTTMTSGCVVKVPDAQPSQLGFLLQFLPTSVPLTNGDHASAFPGSLNPEVKILGAFSGDLGVRSGKPQSVYELAEPEVLKKLKPLVMGSAAPKPLAVGQSLDLPDGLGKLEYTGVKEWITLQTSYDPGRFPALVAAATAVVAIALSLMIRRRRVFVRISGGRAEVGGLTRTEGSAAGFAEEFADIVKVLSAGEKDVR
ncbi:cytochrome c biogenesis protein ResB [Nonomuraea gerenzanensis]|uniref:Ccs1/ResB-related putative cytochrome C-type biogenesis protein n=1 Tax=Nonomuraea gerenzanensis TaxID=93944 RepID=A0A1M4DYC1_9ACTN|nr:cytochrome c biogenesis protein ResB [Nonomuraea gerenzanensis]UBU13884.1 cytochrome c biogenesis protein ResB [Nonomuraea gerenzanensis]SBO91564.1 Ccs1/ResB-related putative cytochrome C-type biogenesis protein [Nonomuraea gerenzanensis]